MRGDKLAEGKRSKTDRDNDDLVAALARPEIYPQRPATVSVHETHISWVFVAGDRAYKLEKPLVLPSLDYGSPARRRLMCHEEVRLNRRLAPDIYLGVLGVAADRGGFKLTSESDPGAVDFVVEMRRYDERQTLAAKLDCGELERWRPFPRVKLRASRPSAALRKTSTSCSVTSSGAARWPGFLRSAGSRMALSLPTTSYSSIANRSVRLARVTAIYARTTSSSTIRCASSTASSSIRNCASSTSQTTWRS
jgi:hypothetical protein